MLFEGVPGAMLYSSARQINAIVPFTMYGRTLIRVQVETDGLASDAYWINMAESSPVVWHDTTLPIVFNQDGTLNSYNNPAAAGSIVIVYATGLGRTVPEGQDGIPAATPYPHPRIALTASTGDILYAGDAPGFVQGLSQINFRAPSTNESVVFQQGAAMFSVFVYAR